MNIRQFFRLLRQQRLFSSIYIICTALSVALAMTLFLVLYIKFGPVYPEQERARMAVVDYVAVRNVKSDQALTGRASFQLADTLRQMPEVECVTCMADGERNASIEEVHVRVKAVCSDIKTHDYKTPSPTLLVPTDDMFFTTCALVRLKKGVNGDDFKASMEHDVQPRCTMDYVTRYEIKSLADIARKANERSGMYNTMRLRSAMSFFGLLCVFLGVSGLFWVRCNERRQDIGIMRSMGASRRDICRQMLTEATLLLSMAFLPALLYVLWHVRANGYDIGMAESSLSGKADMAYWFNRPVPHVATVTIITYTTILLITLLATWLPVQRASRILPSDALRDE